MPSRRSDGQLTSIRKNGSIAKESHSKVPNRGGRGERTIWSEKEARPWGEAVFCSLEAYLSPMRGERGP